MEHDLTRARAFAVLGLEPSASSTEIQRAFKQLSLQYHPDKVLSSSTRDTAAAHDRFTEIANARDKLVDCSREGHCHGDSSFGFESGEGGFEFPSPPQKCPSARTGTACSCRECHASATFERIFGGGNTYAEYDVFEDELAEDTWSLDEEPLVAMVRGVMDNCEHPVAAAVRDGCISLDALTELRDSSFKDSDRSQRSWTAPVDDYNNNFLHYAAAYQQSELVADFGRSCGSDSFRAAGMTNSLGLTPADCMSCKFAETDLGEEMGATLAKMLRDFEVQENGKREEDRD